MKTLLLRAGLALTPAILLVGALGPTPARAAEFTVNSAVEALDANPGDGICDDGSGACPFRAALMETNALPGADVVRVPEGVFAGYVTVERSPEDSRLGNLVAGDPIVTDDLSIIGAGSSASTIAWLYIDPFMEGVSLSVSGLTVGYAGTGGRKISIGKTATASFEDVVVRGGSHGYGSGILNEGTAELRGVVIEGGTTCCRGAGAGIYNTGRMSLTDTVVRGNIADGRGGGGIYNEAGGVMTLERVQINNNYGGWIPGGGVHNAGDMTMNNVALRGNQGAFDAAGTGIYNGGTLSLSNAEISGGREGVAVSNSGEARLANLTVSGNEGGGIGNGSELGTAKMSIINSTITGNPIRLSGRGGGIWSTGGIVEISHSIVTGSGDPACNGTISSLGHNVDSDGSCGLSAAGDLSGVDPRLGPLADNGGLTQTHSLLAGSPAIDGGGSCPPPETDQRGISRPRDGDGDGVSVCDIGAYELEVPYPPEAPSAPEALPLRHVSPPETRQPMSLPLCH